MRPHPPRPQNCQQKNRKHAEESDPASQAGGHARPNPAGRELNRKQQQIKRQYIQRRPRHARLGPKTSIANLAFEFERDQSHVISKINFGVDFYETAVSSSPASSGNCRELSRKSADQRPLPDSMASPAARISLNQISG